MSRDQQKLVPAFREKVDRQLVSCARQGVEMRAFYTERTPWEQARIYRSTRATAQILKSAEYLRESGASYLANILTAVGPQHSPPGSQGHLTNALPGASWHQWGEAVDCFWLLEGEAIWSVKHTISLNGQEDVNGYLIYGEEAIEQGLLSGGMAWGWDWPHVQLRSESSPLDAGYSWPAISTMMHNRYGDNEVS